jgi:hypothetical protein
MAPKTLFKLLHKETLGVNQGLNPSDPINVTSVAVSLSSNPNLHEAGIRIEIEYSADVALYLFSKRARRQICDTFDHRYVEPKTIP